MVTVWHNLDDAALLKSIGQGSHHAFAALVQRHNERFYRLAYRYMANREMAEDIVQDAFLKLWETPDKWSADKGAQFTTWFYRIVVNLCLDHKKKKRELLDEDATFKAVDNGDTPDSQAMRREEQSLLEQAIQSLPITQQSALNLCVYEELSNQEAAEIMGTSLKAVQSLIMRAKTTLKQQLAQYKQKEKWDDKVAS